MNTRRPYTAVYLEKGKNYVFCNEELEPAFERDELEIIADKWNNGFGFKKIAEEHERDPDEIFLAIFHLAREGKIHRKINCKKQVKHIEMKENIPTVIEYQNRRYVYESETNWR